jgi:hypothetical protein
MPMSPARIARAFDLKIPRIKAPHMGDFPHIIAGRSFPDSS